VGGGEEHSTKLKEKILDEGKVKERHLKKNYSRHPQSFNDEEVRDIIQILQENTSNEIDGGEKCPTTKRKREEGGRAIVTGHANT